jgi:hypothetical protein
VSSIPQVEIKVEKSEQYATYRQTIRPSAPESVPDLLLVLYRQLRTQKFTGPVTIHMSMGGVRSIVTEQIARVQIGSPADAALEVTYGTKSNNAA